MAQRDSLDHRRRINVNVTRRWASNLATRKMSRLALTETRPSKTRSTVALLVRARRLVSVQRVRPPVPSLPPTPIAPPVALAPPEPLMPPVAITLVVVFECVRPPVPRRPPAFDVPVEPATRSGGLALSVGLHAAQIATTNPASNSHTEEFMISTGPSWPRTK